MLEHLIPVQTKSINVTQMVVEYFRYCRTLTEMIYECNNTNVIFFRKRSDTLQSHSLPLIYLPYDPYYYCKLGCSHECYKLIYLDMTHLLTCFGQH